MENNTKDIERAKSLRNAVRSSKPSGDAKDGRGYVYMIKSLDLFKIGRAINIDSRLRKYSTENPHGIKMVCAMQIDQYMMVERAIHDYFRDKREIGEWFRLDDHDVVAVAYLMAVGI